MVVVLAILVTGIGLTIGWSITSYLPDLRLKIAVTNLKSDMSMARMTAIRHNTFAVADFSVAHNSYAIYLDDGGGDNTKANNYCRDVGERTIKTIRIHPHVSIHKAQFGSVPGKFAFNSRGTVDGLAGGVYLSNRIQKYRGLTVSRIGKLTEKVSQDGNTWHRLE